MNSIGDANMPSDAEELQFTQATRTLTEFIRILVKEYPLVFKDGSGNIRLHSSVQPLFPFEVTLDIRKKE